MLNELNNFVYVNHLGQRFDSLANGVYLNHSNILDYSWNYDVVNERISRFYRSTTKRSLPLVVIGKTEEEAKAARNRLFEIAEVDVLAMLPGKIYVGEHYSPGFITASKKSRYLYNKRYCNLNLEFTSADPAWYYEKNYTFRKGGEYTPDKPEEDKPEGGGIKPEGTLTITANGTYDVTKYAAVTVSISVDAPEKAVTATDDGKGNVTLANVTATNHGGGNISIE